VFERVPAHDLPKGEDLRSQERKRRTMAVIRGNIKTTSNSLKVERRIVF